MSDEPRVVLVTGGGGGLGGGVARLLAQAGGWRIALVDNRVIPLDAVVAELNKKDQDVFGHAVDLADPAAAEAVIPTVLDRYGRVDAVINTAAILHRQEWDEVTPDDFDLVMRTNTLAPFLLARAAMKDMTKRGWGRIVNVTSTGVYEGGFTMTSALYEASKGAVAVLTKMLGRQGASDGILVNAVCPGAMRTRMLTEQSPPELIEQAEREMIPLGRIAEPVEIAQMCVWLASPENTYATGAIFDVTGGLALH